MDHGSRPDGLELARTTDEFDSTTVPRGLLRAHRTAVGVWGTVRVRAGSLRFTWEDDTTGDSVVELVAGDSLVIPPDTPHRVELADDTRFVVEFYR